MWNLIQIHWIRRNFILHDTEDSARLSGVDELKVAITKEYEKGIGELP